jgi:hypothetical protein
MLKVGSSILQNTSLELHENVRSHEAVTLSYASAPNNLRISLPEYHFICWSRKAYCSSKQLSGQLSPCLNVP